jgi:D-lactate dehydrogenase
MKTAVFSTQGWVRDSFDHANQGSGSSDSSHELTYFEPRLGPETVPLAADHQAVCAFVNDELSAEVLDGLAELGVRLIAMRCAGVNNVDVKHAGELGIGVARVPAYSPYAVAEHALGMILSLNRRFHRAYSRVRDGNFALGGLLGFDMHGKTIGVIGTGKIGGTFARLLAGFGMTVLGYDKYPNEQWAAEHSVRYVELVELYRESDIISLHCPLTPETHHLINDSAIAEMKPGIMIINTSRGPLIDTDAVIDGLKSGKIGNLGLDVYEEESSLFYADLSDQVIQDDTFMRLLTFPNVLITAHQAFFTREAISNIATTTLANISEFENSGRSRNQVEG